MLRCVPLCGVMPCSQAVCCVSLHVMLRYAMLCCIALRFFLVSLFFVLLCNVLCCVAQCLARWGGVWCGAVVVLSCFAVLCYVLRYVMLCYVMLYVMLCYVMLYVMLC